MQVVEQSQSTERLDNSKHFLRVGTQIEGDGLPGSAGKLEVTTSAPKLVLQRLERSPSTERRQQRWRTLEPRSLDETHWRLQRGNWASRRANSNELTLPNDLQNEINTEQIRRPQDVSQNVAKTEEQTNNDRLHNSEDSSPASSSATNLTNMLMGDHLARVHRNKTTDKVNSDRSKSNVSSSPRLQGKLDVCASSLPLIIPTFTVTINPLEDNELTFVPESPTAANRNDAKSSRNTASSNHLLSTASEEVDRRSSIGSASSLEERKASQDELLAHNHLSLKPDLSIRRVSDISHINELRQGVSGMEHLASQYYEITRDSNPDNVSLDSVHKAVFQRCQHKFIRPERSSRQNQLFVILTSICTILGILYGFWYKNFGNGHRNHT